MPGIRAASVAVLALTAACAGRWSGMGAAGPLGRPEPADALRVMTFNIRYGTAPDGPDAWPNRRGAVFALVGARAPAILGLQEALRFQIDELVARFPHLGELGAGRDDGAKAGEYAAILFDRRRLEPLATGQLWLSPRPDQPGSLGWGARFPRVVTWARFRDRERDRAFFVFNTHWDHESARARDESARLMLERIRSRTPSGDPVLVTGDFNAGERDPAFQALLVELVDTFRAVHPDAREVGTYHAFRGGTAGAKLDAVLASPEWEVVDAGIVAGRHDGRYPSDHHPVVATVRLP
jgi:endonuclease/exonuclease/phosphatase family metal-dependent hydrolase